jgi:uncharacterized OB-fold protein
MSAPFTVDVCERCGYAAYPPRILCPGCGGSKWRRQLAATGVVQETTVRRPVFKRRQLPGGNWLDQSETRLGAVRTDLGPVVIARVPESARPGDRVRLQAHASTAIALPGQVVEALRAAPVD